MVENLIPCYRFNLIILSYCVFLSCFFVRSYSLGEVDAYGTFSISSFRYPETRLRPFDSRYFRGKGSRFINFFLKINFIYKNNTHVWANCSWSSGCFPLLSSVCVGGINYFIFYIFNYQFWYFTCYDVVSCSSWFATVVLFIVDSVGVRRWPRKRAYLIWEIFYNTKCCWSLMTNVLYFCISMFG